MEMVKSLIWLHWAGEDLSGILQGGPGPIQPTQSECSSFQNTLKLEMLQHLFLDHVFRVLTQITQSEGLLTFQKKVMVLPISSGGRKIYENLPFLLPIISVYIL